MAHNPVEFTVMSGVAYRVEHTDEEVGDLCWRWGERRAAQVAERANDDRIAPTVRYEIRRMGWGRWRVVALQNLAVKTIPEEVLHGAEDAIMADIFPGAPPVWRCACGGRPFVGKPCPRCGREP